MERLTVLSLKREIQISDLPEEMRGDSNDLSVLKVKTAKAIFMKEYLEKLLHASGGNVAIAAHLSGMRREYLYALIRKNKKKGKRV